MNAVDTNVWIYSHDVREPEKKDTATTLVTTLRPHALLWQVGCEFIAAARKLSAHGPQPDEASRKRVIVKHFKYEQRGKRRLHSTPNARAATRDHTSRAYRGAPPTPFLV